MRASRELSGPGYLGPDSKGDFTELGKGIVDFPALSDLYRAIGFQGWVQLELDQTREPNLFASATDMKAYLPDKLTTSFLSTASLKSYVLKAQERLVCTLLAILGPRL